MAGGRWVSVAAWPSLRASVTGHPRRVAFSSFCRQLRVCRKGGVQEEKAGGQVSFCARDPEKLLFGRQP